MANGFHSNLGAWHGCGFHHAVPIDQANCKTKAVASETPRNATVGFGRAHSHAHAFSPEGTVKGGQTDACTISAHWDSVTQQPAEAHPSVRTVWDALPTFKNAPGEMVHFWDENKNGVSMCYSSELLDTCPTAFPESPGKPREVGRDSRRAGCGETPWRSQHAPIGCKPAGGLAVPREPLYSQPLAGPPVRGGRT